MLTLKPSLFRVAKKHQALSARSVQMQAAYTAYQNRMRATYGDNPPCPLCDNMPRRSLRSDTATMWVVKNDFPYERYDGMKVAEHLMIVPRHHYDRLGQFNAEEQTEYWRLYSAYMENGYTSMTRSLTDKQRSVPGHLHTHLLHYTTE